MGLTIHYTLTSDLENPKDAHNIVDKLRHRARKLPFDYVGRIIEASGNPAYDPDNLDRGDGTTWLKIQACHTVEYKIKGEEHWASVPPTHLIAFGTHPGEGCESANFGLCLYPKTHIANGKTIKTKVTGWRWHSFCKTQYASNPDHGGLENFLRCHVGLVKLLDYAIELGLGAKVNDESGYWKDRDEAALVEQIEKWNQVVAGFVGAMKDKLVGPGKVATQFAAEITKFPNFEHLEAKGRSKRK